MRHRRLSHVKIALEIGLQRAVEMRLGQVLKIRDVFLERGIVDQDVEAAEMLGGPSHGLLAKIRIGDNPPKW
jgi:hypothetical protein